VGVQATVKAIDASGDWEWGPGHTEGAGSTRCRETANKKGNKPKHGIVELVERFVRFHNVSHWDLDTAATDTHNLACKLELSVLGCASFIIEWKARDDGRQTCHVLAAPAARSEATEAQHTSENLGCIATSNVAADCEVAVTMVASLDLEFFVVASSVKSGHFKIFEIAHTTRAHTPHAAVLARSSRNDGADVFEGGTGFVLMSNLPVTAVVAGTENTRMMEPQAFFSIGVVGPRTAATKKDFAGITE